MAVRERFVELIKARGWSQREFARRLGEPPHWVHDRTKGRIKIAADELPRLAAALGVDVRAFFDDEPEDHGKRREELIREGYDIFRSLGQKTGQSMDQGTVLDAIRQLLREYDEQKGKDGE